MSDSVYLKEDEGLISIAKLNRRINSKGYCNINGYKVVGIDISSDCLMIENKDKEIGVEYFVIDYDISYGSIQEIGFLQLDNNAKVITKSFFDPKYINFNTVCNEGVPFAIKIKGKLLINADLSEAMDFEKYGTLVSFDCTGNLFGDLKNLTVVNSSKEERKTFEDISIEKVLDWIGKGFSLSNEAAKLSIKRYRKGKITKDHVLPVALFHKSGNCLIKHRTGYGIFGFDDGQYFGCLLQPQFKPKTCNAALNCLRPERVDPTSMRQGEWYFDKVDNKEVKLTSFPQTSVTVCSAGKIIKIPQNYTFDLSLDDIDSNTHSVTCDKFRFDDSGRLYLNRFTVKHIEHPEINIKDAHWYEVVKNTAVLSVSSEGVD